MFEKIGMIIRDMFDVYGKRIRYFILISLLFTVAASLLATNESIKFTFENTISFFSTLMVIEIAFFGIFFSGSDNNEKARKMIVNEDEDISYYQSLLVKNFNSIFLKMINIILAYIINIFGLTTLKSVILFENWNLEIKIGFYLIFYFLFIYTIIIMTDLIVSIYFFLWKS